MVLLPHLYLGLLEVLDFLEILEDHHFLVPQSVLYLLAFLQALDDLAILVALLHQFFRLLLALHEYPAVLFYPFFLAFQVLL